MSVPVKLGASFERGQGQLLFEDIRFLGESPLPSTDGQRLLALLRTDEDSQAAAITVVTNWRTTLKR